MRGHFETCGTALLALLLSLGCSALTDFGKYQPNGGRDDGGMDGSVPDPDGGGDEDGGDRDGGDRDGGDRDGGADDGGPGDGGPPACDPTCAEGETCVDGNCMCGTRSACGETEACCGGECRALGTVTDCGGCDEACPTRANATATCTGTVCSFECNTGFEDCNGEASDGCEDSLSTTADCGMCDETCAAGEVCADVGGGRACRTDCSGSMVACGGTCFTPGGPCTCQPGAVEGTQMCDASTMSPVCDYPAEACNTVDDDCDGVVNNGFACTPGQMRSCTSSCGSTGVQLCGTTCAWSGSCVAMERCDRMDTDCDGFVDEGLVAAGAPFMGSDTSLKPRAAYHAGVDELGVVVGASGTTLLFLRTSLDGRVIPGSMTVLPISGSAVDWDIAFDGSDYVVAVASHSPSSIQIVRLDPAGAVGALVDMPITTAPPRRVRIDRIGTLPEVAVLHTTERFGSGATATVNVLRVPSGVGSAPTQIASWDLASSGGGGGRWFRAPAVVRTAAEAVLAFTETTGSGEIHLQLIGAGGVLGPTTVFAGDGLDEVNTEMAFDPVTRLVGITYQKLDAAGALGPGHIAALDLSALSVSDMPVDPSPLEALQIATAADGNFGVLIRTTGGTTRLVRLRARDRAIVSSPIAPPADYAAYLQGVPRSANRYVGFRGAGATFATLPYACGP